MVVITLVIAREATASGARMERSPMNALVTTVLNIVSTHEMIGNNSSHSATFRR
ncbi:hypothetical protein [Bradyrhizobium sp. 1]|uniref:hypothetical protein n=1 Tax=Bradyrhizobium sp. 1 TaxID=241591 RepID=UPI001FF724DF|nr:hypothetical protein [Bradyrhizobium sp. 1]MCK1393856.1 hypothetical protein [Bradyrhizobium sp. 1]